MQCDICFRSSGQGEKRLHFLCPTDARNQLYHSRIQNARVLLEKDALDQQITALLSARPEDNADPIETSLSPPDIVFIHAEKEQAEDRTRRIITQADELKAKVESAREDIARRKAILARRRSDLASAQNGVDSRRIRQVDDVEKGIRITKYKWNQGHATTAASRTFLCGEAAKLYGLKKSRKHGGGEEYRIGGIGIMDLRSLNSKCS